MSDRVRLFLVGDVMTGRGIDQLFRRSSQPVLHERYVSDARRYVELAESASGPIDRPVDDAYIWGDLPGVLERYSPNARIVNLETSVTRSNDYWQWKGIHYRMHPANVSCLTAAGIDCCVLANNHVLDWGIAGLKETVAVLRSAGLHTAGAGDTVTAAHAPAILDAGFGRRILVFAFGAESSGIPAAWAARTDSPGVSLVSSTPRAAEATIAEAVSAWRRPGDLVVVSMHWGGNWGYAIPQKQRELAHGLIEREAADVVHGHSSHHPKGIEIFRGRPILYGCGDFVNDYEGISGYEEYRGDLRLAYFIEMDPVRSAVTSLTVVPFQSRRLQLRLAADADVEHVRAMLERECLPFGIRVTRGDDKALELALNAGT